VQSPCVTFGSEESQIKAHRESMQPLAKVGHDPTDALRAMDLARHYGAELHTGVFYRNPEPPPTYEAQVEERHQALTTKAPPRERILERFLQS